jgi:metal-sulfur cluster biosynthetic enzyme
MNKLQTKIQRRLVKAMGAWRDPHMTKPLLESDNVQAIDISEEGNVRIKFRPSRPHCPCCLIDAKELKLHLQGTKGVNWIQLEIVDVPASERWSRLVND